MYAVCKNASNNLFPPKLISSYAFNPFSNEKKLDSSKLKEFTGDNFNVHENGRKLSKWVENIVGNGEIARYEQFLLFPVFIKDFYCKQVKSRACLGKG